MFSPGEAGSVTAADLGVGVGVNEVNEVFRWFRWLQAPEEQVWPQPVCRLLLQLPPQNQRGPRHPTCDYLL